MLDVKIRSINYSDIPYVLMLKKLADVSNVLKKTSRKNLETIIFADFTESREYLVKKINTTTGFVVEYSDCIIGCGFLVDIEAYIIIETVYVEPSFQGQGIGSYLINFFISESKRSGKKYIQLETATAQDFYKKLGFKDLENTFKMRYTL